ncbi:MAG: helix-turn-helix transcriptional regulator [Chloroflexota bacterium]
MQEDIQAFDDAKQRIAKGEELIPSTVTYALLDGENPIQVWREYRGLTRTELAERAEINESYLAELESDRRKSTTDVLITIAQALDLELEDLYPA